MLPRVPPDRIGTPTPPRLPALAAPSERGASEARAILGSLRERLGTERLQDHRATGRLDTTAMLQATPPVVDLEHVAVPRRDADSVSIGPGRPAPASRLTLG